MTGAGPLRRVAQAALVAGLLATCGGARATLGEPASSIARVQALLQGGHRIALSASTHYQVHVITLADGSAIREFVGPSGIVFAVSWSTRLKPRLDALLGAHAMPYRAAASAALVAPGVRHRASVATGDLVVEAHEHANAHSGIAYLRSLVPEGVRLDELR